MSDFWNELFEKIDEQPYMDNRARKAEVIAEKKAKKLYSKLIDEATNEEELTEVWYLIAPELDKIAKEIAENLVVREWKPISDYLRKQLFGEQTDLRKVLAQFTAETELGNLKVKLIEGAPMGSLEYDGDEAVWFVTVMEGDRYVANVPFVSDDGKKPDEAQMLYDQLNNNDLNNWPDPVKQKVQDSAFGGVNYIERREGEKVEISEASTDGMEKKSGETVTFEYGPDDLKKMSDEELFKVYEDYLEDKFYYFQDPAIETLAVLNYIESEIWRRGYEIDDLDVLNEAGEKIYEFPREKGWPLFSKKESDAKATPVPFEDIEMPEGMSTEESKALLESYLKATARLNKLGKKMSEEKHALSELEESIIPIIKQTKVWRLGFKDKIIDLARRKRKSKSWKSIVGKIRDEFEELNDAIDEFEKEFESVSTWTEVKVSKTAGILDKFKSLWDKITGKVARIEEMVDDALSKEASVKEAQEKGKVIIQVVGGIADLVSAPPGISVEVRDYDVGEGDPEGLEKDKNGDMYELITLAQDIFTPTDFAAEPPDLMGEPEAKAEEPKGKSTKTKSYHTSEEIRRWFGGHIPRRDSHVKDQQGNLWRFIGPAGPDTYEIELVEEQGASPDEVLGEPSGLEAPGGEGPTEVEQMEIEEGAPAEEQPEAGGALPFEEEAVGPQPILTHTNLEKEAVDPKEPICENCRNFRLGRNFCTFWDVPMDPDDTCDQFDVRERGYKERYTEAPAMKADLAPTGSEDSLTKEAQIDVPAMDIVEMYNEDPNKVREKIASMDQDSFAHLIDEVSKIKGADVVKDFLDALWNDRYSERKSFFEKLGLKPLSPEEKKKKKKEKDKKKKKKKDKKKPEPEGQTPFYKSDAPLSLDTPPAQVPTSVKEFTTKIDLKKSGMNEYEDEDMVKEAFEMFPDQRIREIKADNEYLYVTFVEE